MSRYIDLDKAIPIVIDAVVDVVGHGISQVDAVRIVEKLEEIPIENVVKVRHGHWKETTHITESKRGREIHSKLYNCSYCDAPNGRKKSSYCHWCGAKMDGERREG